MLKIDNFPDELKALNAGLPDEYYTIFDRGLINLDPWQFVDSASFAGLYEVLRQLYPDSVYTPFARRIDNDDVACIVVRHDHLPQNRIVIVHMFASAGSEIDETYAGFWDWFRAAVDEMIETFV